MKTILILAANPGLQYIDTAVTQFILQAILHLAGELSPIPTRIAELALAVVHDEIYRLSCPSVDDNTVEPAALEFGTPIAAGLRFTKAAGQG